MYLKIINYISCVTITFLLLICSVNVTANEGSTVAGDAGGVNNVERDLQEKEKEDISDYSTNEVYTRDGEEYE